MEDYIKEYNIFKKFNTEGYVLSFTPYGEGHINSSFLVETTKQKYFLQEINTVVFKNPEHVMNNILLVTEFIRKKGALTLSVIRTKDGKLVLHTDEGCYRLYDFIDNSLTLQKVESETDFYNAGCSFGEFQKSLTDFDSSSLYETIENFHNTPKRYEDFNTSVKLNKCGRLDTCRDEVRFVTERADTFGEIVKGISDGSIPLRVTHNDTKLNNIIMDPNTRKGKAIIDLDTVMPGSMLYDFGDAIRFGASTAAEDEKDLSKVHFDISLFKAFSEGFCGVIKDSITPREHELLPYSAYLMTMECGMRFLADYIDGDIYFATKYPEHNLVRCRTQFKLAYEMQQKMDEMKKIVDNIVFPQN